MYFATNKYFLITKELLLLHSFPSTITQNDTKKLHHLAPHHGRVPHQDVRSETARIVKLGVTNIIQIMIFSYRVIESFTGAIVEKGTVLEPISILRHQKQRRKV